MSVHRGQIVMVDFPYADRTGSRVRPALVVQADDLNAALNATVPAMITSSRSRMVGHPCQYLIDSAHLDYPSSGLRTDSLIQCNIRSTLEQRLVLRAIGSLSAASMLEIDECLKAALGIA